MMLPYAQVTASTTKKKSYITNFQGYNALPEIADGEFTDMVNMGSDNMPYLSPRKCRVYQPTTTAGTALGSKDKMYWVDGTNFVYDGTIKGTITTGTKCFVNFNNRILIFPDKAYYDTSSGAFGAMGTSTPDIDFACEYFNRVIGVKGNNVYISKLGDSNTWDDFSGLTTDSWSTTVPSTGKFTGIIPYQNHVVIFKQDFIYTLMGYKPSNFQIVGTGNLGCRDGCSKSICIVNEILFYQSIKGIMAYTGGVPRLVSQKLNNGYPCSVAGTDGRKYYGCQSLGGLYKLIVIDTWNNNVIHIEDGIHILEFTKYQSFLYGLSETGQIVSFDWPNGESFNWSATSKIFTEIISEKKSLSQINIRAELPANSTLTISIKYNNSAWQAIQTINTADFRTVLLPIKMNRVDHYQLKFEGIGNVKIHNLERIYSVGSDK